MHSISSSRPPSQLFSLIPQRDAHNLLFEYSAETQMLPPAFFALSIPRKHILHHVNVGVSSLLL
jgi:hypothetical protein